MSDTPKLVEDFVESLVEGSPLWSGMETSEEASQPAFADPVGVCAWLGLFVGAFLGSTATVGIWYDLPAPRPPILAPVVAFGVLGSVLGAFTWGLLRSFDDALWGAPGAIAVIAFALLGAAVGGLATLVDGVPAFETALAGVVVGGVLALLYQAFQDWLA